jgi:hypothetical protein
MAAAAITVTVVTTGIARESRTRQSNHTESMNPRLAPNVTNVVQTQRTSGSSKSSRAERPYAPSVGGSDLL